MIKACTVVFLLLITQQALASNKISLCYNMALIPPFITKAPTIESKGEGLFFDYLNKLEQSTQLAFDLHNLPSKRCKDAVKRGDFDGIPGMLWSEQRANQFLYPKGSGEQSKHPQRMDTVTNVIFVHVDSKLVWDGQSFSNVKYGLGANYSFMIHAKLKRDGVLSRDILTAEQGLKLIAMKKLDGYVLEDIVGYESIKKFRLKNKIKALPIPYDVTDLHFTFSKRLDTSKQNIPKRIWRAIEQINLANSNK